MKVIAIVGRENLLVEMSYDELGNLAGYRNGFSHRASGAKVEHCNETYTAKAIGEGLEIEMSKIYTDATSTLEAYSELKTKLESVRNQLTFLTGKMNELKIK